MKRKTTLQTNQTSVLPISKYVTRDLSSVIESVKFFFKNFRTSSSDSNSFSTVARKKGNMKKFLPIALLLIIIGGVIIIAGRMVVASTKPTNSDQRAEVKGPKASIKLNKEFSFPLLDAKGKELTRIKYTVENAELRDEIIVKGTRATSIKGRTFLIVNIKLVNDYDKAIDLKARDYLRLSVNGNDTELLAADIHNDPVNLQPISTKVTRLGFPINDTDSKLVLKVGEIKGNKESVPLNF